MQLQPVRKVYEYEYHQKVYNTQCKCGRDKIWGGEEEWDWNVLGALFEM